MRIQTFLALASVSFLAAGCSDTLPPRYASAPIYTDYGDAVESGNVVTPEDRAAVAAEVQSTSDQQLATSIRHQFDRYGDLSGISPNVDILARDGTVTLTGSVPGAKEKQMIDAMVRNTPGVVQVNDLLRVADDRSTYYPPTGRVEQRAPVYANSGTETDVYNLHVQSLTDDDRRLGRHIIADLKGDTALASTVPKVEINIVNGRVTLRGIVETEQQHATILAAAQQAVGAENVDDDLRVRELPR